MAVTPLDVARYKRLAVRASDVWQGGIVRLPAWVQANAREEPRRVLGAFWVSTRTGLVWMLPQHDDEPPGAALAVEALGAFAKKYDKQLLGRPARLEVTDAALADAIRALLDDASTTIAVARDLPNVRDALREFARLADEAEGRPWTPDLLSSKGVTLDRLRGFADAAARFYGADPWNALAPEDLVTIEAPVVDPALRHLSVTGSTRDLRGITFFKSPEHFLQFTRRPPRPGDRKPDLWILSFDPIDWMPFGDIDAWLDHALPVAAPDAYPRPGRIRPDDGLHRPDATQLALLEAVLRALAATTDDEYDAGRWTRQVDTVDGPVDVRLALPFLLDKMSGAARGRTAARDAIDPMRIRLDMERAMRRAAEAIRASGAASFDDAKRAFEDAMRSPQEGTAAADDAGATPLDRAQDLAYQAMASAGRRQIQLARQALALSRDCADAWLILAGRTTDTATALARLREGVAAGERALGPDLFESEAGHFWGRVDTRPYMRARFALAQALEADGAIDDAVGHYRELLRLNPGDNQGVRYVLLSCLVNEDRDEDAEALLAAHEDDASAEWAYASALVAFRRQGDSAEARQKLVHALGVNPHVAPLLSGERALPDVPDAYRPGGPDEAAIAADQLLEAWTETPGAVFWLNTVRRDIKRDKRARPTPRGKRPGRAR